MTPEQARRIVGNQSIQCLRNMAIALSIHSILNSAEEWQRMEATCLLLGRKTPMRASAALKRHKIRQEA